VLAPGIAEAVLLVGLGVMAGAVAVIAHWALEARIDRAVLKPS
jgi:biopolymer transport protein ExbB/TolQ